MDETIKEEKRANQLYIMFKNVLHDDSPGINPYAKACAKACVDAILNELTGDRPRMDYWRKVKNHLKLM
jgi:hypothetical protein